MKHRTISKSFLTILTFLFIISSVFSIPDVYISEVFGELVFETGTEIGAYTINSTILGVHLNGTDYNYWTFNNTLNDTNLQKNLTFPELNESLGDEYTYYPMYEGVGATLNDIGSDTNNGAITGATWNTTCKYDNCLYFDGIDDEVRSAGNVGIIGSASRSMCMWTYTPTTDTQGTFGGWGTVVINKWFLSLNWNDKYTLVAHTNDFNSVVPVVKDLWQHHCWTYNGTYTELYVNGTSYGTLAMSLDTGDSILQLGERVGIDDVDYQGNIDEVMIYDRALLSSEVLDLYNSREPTYATGQYNSAIDFNGVDEWVITTNISDILTYNVGSVSLWANIPSEPVLAGETYLFGVGRDTDATETWFGIASNNNTDGFKIILKEDGVTQWNLAMCNGFLNTVEDEFVNLIVTHQGDTPRFYMNGVQCNNSESETDLTSWWDELNNVSPANKLIVGARINGASPNTFTTSVIDDVHIYDYALSQDEISSIAELSGDVIDFVSNNNMLRSGDAVFHSSSRFTSGLERTILFDGVDDYISTTNTTIYDTLTTGSISIWVNISEDNNDLNVLGGFSRNADDVDTEFLITYDFLGQQDSGEVKCVVDGVTQWEFQTPSGYADSLLNRFNNVIITHNGSSAGFFYNGSRIDGDFIIDSDLSCWWKSVLTEATDKADTFGFGGRIENGALTNDFHGSIDSIMTYDFELNSTQISDIQDGFHEQHNTVILFDNSTKPNHIFSYNTEFNLTYCAYLTNGSISHDAYHFESDDLRIYNFHMRTDENECLYITLIDNTTYSAFNFTYTIENHYNNSVVITDELISIDEPTFDYWIWRDVNDLKSMASSFFNNVSCRLFLYDNEGYINNCDNQIDQAIDQIGNIERQYTLWDKISDRIRSWLLRQSCTVNRTNDEAWTLAPINSPRNLSMWDFVDFNIRMKVVETKYNVKRFLCMYTQPIIMYTEP